MGALVIPEIIPPVAHRLHIVDAGPYIAASAVLSMFIFPPILAGIAKRRWLLWAYLPLIVFFLWVFASAFLSAAMDWPADISSGTTSLSPRDTVRAIIIGSCVLFLAPLISAVPVCLFRYLRRRAYNRRIAVALAMDQAMQTPREGVWPPPPTSGSGSL